MARNNNDKPDNSEQPNQQLNNGQLQSIIQYSNGGYGNGGTMLQALHQAMATRELDLSNTTSDEIINNQIRFAGGGVVYEEIKNIICVEFAKNSHTTKHENSLLLSATNLKAAAENNQKNGSHSRTIQDQHTRNVFNECIIKYCSDIEKWHQEAQLAGFAQQIQKQNAKAYLTTVRGRIKAALARPLLQR